MKLTEVTGDLFTADTKYIFAHCISADCAMGAGIAMQFVRRFPKLRGNLRARNPKVGQALFYQEFGRSFFNLMTKQVVWDKPTYASLRAALEAMCAQMQEQNMKYLAMPRIGSGLDKLEWGKVKLLVSEVFANSEVDILIYTL